MSGKGWTPGEWRAGELRYSGACQIVDDFSATRGYICEVQAPIVDGAFDVDGLTKRARLIAAAPDLYAALGAFIDPFEGDSFDEIEAEYGEATAHRVAAGRAALSRASGSEADR